MKLDNDGLRFITLGFTELLDTQLQREATEDVPRDSPDDTRLVVRVAIGKECANVHGKIIWLEDIQRWEVRYKDKFGEELGTDKDGFGNTFSVPGGLEPEEYQRAKFEAKGRAVDLWNSLDQSNRKRVTRMGPEIVLRLPSSSEATSEEIDSTQEPTSLTEP